MSLNPADARFAALIRSTLGEDILRPVEDRYLEEPRGRFAGQIGVLAVPRNTEEVAALVRLAAEERVPVVPYGGGTGLVGGQVISDGPPPLLISLERMTAIRSVFPTENILIAEAGAILQDVQVAAEEVDRLFPLSLAAQGSCRIGGNLSTNAGGVNVLRYGNARDLCLGLEAVLPNGEIWHGLSRLRKDNTGYDLRDLLIGAEGTLGIITAASLKLFPKPAVQGTAMFQVASPEAAIDLLALARDQVGETVSTFELIHRQGFDFLSEVLPDVRRPFSTRPEWCVLIELGLAAGQSSSDALETLYVAAEDRGQVLDGVIAQSEAQRADLWAVRERIPEANRLIGSVSSHDISVPISRIPDFIREGGKMIAELGPYRINCFGHLGDGNLHYNVFPPNGHSRSEFEDQRSVIKQAVHDLVDAYDGSVSAEHGVGRLKTDDLERYGDPVKLSAMRAIKAALDPQGIMNPGAVLKV
ncbi:MULTISPECIES: FAD-binding oxidoreductase [unclassified Ruegeria]|uniref:FAD-binding oxidoreductase n=1 Tax=unclassified Ruegeria TaxID=2625375 RepID=UPI00149119D7|nr:MULTISPECIES: FAD-binding oxidoreductase [unclassified Ruegeria]NOD89550.1 FAD-binding protein [Ruegeria sp. HKCCD4318]NOE13873.1 FAD-binding protein [Ruegeria sp. HKCCD4318-2]NOG08191.1 FAD-binding oxidoreductase [Ruegeria sp. HKCCD4315]